MVVVVVVVVAAVIIVVVLSRKSLICCALRFNCVRFSKNNNRYDIDFVVVALLLLRVASL